MRPKVERIRWMYRDPARVRAVPRRNEEILDALRKGLTFKEIGEKYGITRQRVQQIAQKIGAPSTIEVRRRIREKRVKAEQDRLRQRPCFVCAKPARSTRVPKRAWERLYCEKCRALVTRDTNIKAAMNVRGASLILAAKRTGVCTLCRRKLLGSNAYRGIICIRHDMALRAAVHNAKQAMRDHPELDWQRILREAALCRQCFKRRAAPGLAKCSQCQS
jgi:transcriptional regulator with XRE-family HTH domain